MDANLLPQQKSMLQMKFRLRNLDLSEEFNNKLFSDRLFFLKKNNPSVIL